MVHGEAQEVLAHSITDKAIKRHVFSLLLQRFSFEQKKREYNKFKNHWKRFLFLAFS
jgi:hypothetical protein